MNDEFFVPEPDHSLLTRLENQNQMLTYLLTYFVIIGVTFFITTMARFILVTFTVSKVITMGFQEDAGLCVATLRADKFGKKKPKKQRFVKHIDSKSENSLKTISTKLKTTSTMNTDFQRSSQQSTTCLSNTTSNEQLKASSNECPYIKINRHAKTHHVHFDEKETIEHLKNSAEKFFQAQTHWIKLLSMIKDGRPCSLYKIDDCPTPNPFKNMKEKKLLTSTSPTQSYESSRENQSDTSYDSKVIPKVVKLAEKEIDGKNSGKVDAIIVGDETKSESTYMKMDIAVKSVENEEKKTDSKAVETSTITPSTATVLLSNKSTDVSVPSVVIPNNSEFKPATIKIVENDTKTDVTQKSAISPAVTSDPKT